MNSASVSRTGILVLKANKEVARCRYPKSHFCTSCSTGSIERTKTCGVQDNDSSLHALDNPEYSKI